MLGFIKLSVIVVWRPILECVYNHGTKKVLENMILKDYGWNKLSEGIVGNLALLAGAQSGIWA